MLSCGSNPEQQELDRLFSHKLPDSLKTAGIAQRKSYSPVPADLLKKFVFPEEVSPQPDDLEEVVAIQTWNYPKHTAYLLLFKSAGSNSPHVIALYLYNTESKKMSAPRVVDYSFGSEGTENSLSSWIVDLNNDKQPDIVSHSYQCSLLGSDATPGTFVDTLNAWIWQDTGFKSVPLDGYKQLKSRFSIDCICACGTK